jgi:hypothetical protein
MKQGVRVPSRSAHKASTSPSRGSAAARPIAAAPADPVSALRRAKALTVARSPHPEFLQGLEGAPNRDAVQRLRVQQALQASLDRGPRGEASALRSPLLRLGSPAIQRVLTAHERSEKERVLRDYVQYTPPTLAEFRDQYGAPPASKVAYKLKLIEKITAAPHIIRSLKSKAPLVADAEDDTWTEPSVNVTELVAAIDHIYDNGLAPRNAARLIGQAAAPFDQHDCVWAAVCYGLNRPNTLAEERAIAAAHSSQEGEVEDSILYRIMENLGWPYQGEGAFDEMFPTLQPGVATFANIQGRFDGRYVISEDKNAGGTAGHVLAVDVADTADPAVPLGFRRVITYTDRQHERAHHAVARGNKPAFKVHVWKVP